MSAYRRVQRDKRLDHLKKESVKLNEDVEHLQDALLLHQRFREDEGSTIRGMLKKEIGGSIWQHGGAGKLRTYKSTKDLADPYGTGTPNSKTKDSSRSKVTKIVSDGVESNYVKHRGLNGSSKPSEKNGPSKTAGNRLDNENDSYHSNGSNGMERIKVQSSIGRDVPPGCESFGNTRQDNEADSRKIGNYDLQKMELLKTKVIEKASANVITRKKCAGKYNIPDNKKVVSENPLSNTSGRVKSSPVKSRRENSRERRSQTGKVDKLQRENQKRQTKHENSAPRNSMDLESNEIQEESHRLTSPKFPKQTNRIFVDDSGSKSPLGIDNQAILDDTDQQNVCHSLDTSPKQVLKCDPDVQLWLRRLGLLEEEKYVQIFAKNEIDMEELLLLTPEQLTRLGVVAVGAFNKIVRGIQELQQKSSWTGEMLSQKSNNTLSQTTADNCPTVSENDWNTSQESSPYRTTPWKDRSIQDPKGIVDGVKKPEFRALNSQDNASDKMSSHSSEPNNFDKMSFLEHDLHNEKHKPVYEGGGKRDTKKLDIDGNKRILSRSNSFNSRSSTSKPPVKREQERASKKDIEKNSDKKKKGQGKSQPRPRSRSLTRRGSMSNIDSKAPTSENVKQKMLIIRPESAKVEAVDTNGQQKKHPAVNAATQRLEERQKMEKDLEEKEKKSRERRKQHRDELAAKHLSRERGRRGDEEEVDTMAHIQQWATEVTNHTLADLLTVSVLDTGSHTDEVEANGQNVPTSGDLKDEGSRPFYSRRTPKVSSRQSIALPSSDVTKENPNKFLVSSSLRISSRPPKHSSTKQGSSTAVRDLEQQIQSLQDRAMSGELITMDLVRDLQNRLVQVENQVTNQKLEQFSKSLGKNQSTDVTNSNLGNEITRLNLDDDSSRSDVDDNRGSRLKQEESNSLFEDTVTVHSNESEDDIEDDISMMKEQIKIRNSYHRNTRSSIVSMSMSKQALLSEIKKEKAQHRKQIRHLNSELNRIRQTEPVRSIEVDRNDVQFDEQDLIGEGTFSRVYKGKYQGSDVAVKQLKMPLSSQDRNYFNAEVSLLRDLRHPRVVLLMGVCSSSRLPLMVLEYMARGSLYHHLHGNNREPLDHAEYFRISHDIALGMAYLHQQKPAVLHLDLKSMNVLICSNDRAKIADFGFSKLRYDANLNATKTSKTKPVHGSPGWIAPELLETGEVTPKADVYSFGIILWEMLTRKQPYDGCSVFQVLERVRLNKRPEIHPSCPEQLSKFIQQCWAPVPAKRPPFKEILTQLEDMTFPSEWQDLFRVAGVPPEALEDVHSTRTIISLVTNSLDTANAKSLIEDIKLKRSFGTYVEDRPYTDTQGPLSPNQSDHTKTSTEIRPTCSLRKSQDILNEVLQSRDLSPRKINSSRSPREHLAQMNKSETRRKPVEPLVIPTGKDDSSQGTPRSVSLSSPDTKPLGSSRGSPDTATPLRNSQDLRTSSPDTATPLRNSQDLRTSSPDTATPLRNSQDLRTSSPGTATPLRNSQDLRTSSPDTATPLRNSQDLRTSSPDTQMRTEKVRNSVASETDKSVRKSLAAEIDTYQKQFSVRKSFTSTEGCSDVKHSYDVKNPMVSNSPRKQINSLHSDCDNKSRNASNNSVYLMSSRREKNDFKTDETKELQNSDVVELKRNQDLNKNVMSDTCKSTDAQKKGVDLRQSLLSEVRNSKNILKGSVQNVTPKSHNQKGSSVQSSIQKTPRLQKDGNVFQRQVIDTHNSLRKSLQKSPPSAARMMEVDPRGAVIDPIKTPAAIQNQRKVIQNISRDSLNMSQDVELQSVGSIDDDSLDSPQLRDSLEENFENKAKTSSHVCIDRSPRPQMKPKPTGLKSDKNTVKTLDPEQVSGKSRASTNWMAELSFKLQNLGNFSDLENSPDVITSGKTLSSQSDELKWKPDRTGNSVTGNVHYPTYKSNNNVSPHSKHVSSPYKANLQNGAEDECVTSEPPQPQIPAPPPPPPPPPPVISATGGKKQIIKPAIVSKDLPQPSRATNRGLQCGVPQIENVDNSPMLLKSKELRDQKDILQSTSKPHPSQLHDLRHVKKSTMVSIAEILKKAVSSRRMALGEDPNSPPQSVASSWSIMDD